MGGHVAGRGACTDRGASGSPRGNGGTCSECSRCARALDEVYLRQQAGLVSARAKIVVTKGRKRRRGMLGLGPAFLVFAPQTVESVVCLKRENIKGDQLLAHQGQGRQMPFGLCLIR